MPHGVCTVCGTSFEGPEEDTNGPGQECAPCYKRGVRAWLMKRSEAAQRLANQAEKGVPSPRNPGPTNDYFGEDGA